MSTTTTHHNFKSIQNKIQNVEDIYNVIGTLLVHQSKFPVRFPPDEFVHWNGKVLDQFGIDLEKIDRLYHVSCNEVSGRLEYELAARMDYEGRCLYVHAKSVMNWAWDGLVGEGEIYLTFDPQVFLKSTISSNCNPQGIWKSMVEDGFLVEEPSEFDLKQVEAWRNVPMLTYLCHMTVYQQKEQFKPYLQALPRLLAKGVEEFLKVRHARDHRDEIVTNPDYLGVYLISSVTSFDNLNI